MCLDSLYCAMLKYLYTFEFYTTVLKLYTDKGKKDKVALLIDQMKRYKNIRLIPGRYGQDNREWTNNKEQNTISQSLSSIKFISQQCANELYNIRQYKPDSFVQLLRYIQMNTSIKTNQLNVLIGVGYFKDYGRTGKLMVLFEEFYKGKNKLTKTIKSADKRIEILKKLEDELPDIQLAIEDRVSMEYQNIGICFSCDSSSEDKAYYVQDVDDKYGVNIKLYSLQRGTSGWLKMNKKSYQANPIKKGTNIILDKWANRPRYLFKNGQRTKIENEFDFWIQQWHMM